MRNRLTTCKYLPTRVFETNFFGKSYLRKHILNSKSVGMELSIDDPVYVVQSLVEEDAAGRCYPNRFDCRRFAIVFSFSTFHRIVLKWDITLWKV